MQADREADVGDRTIGVTEQRGGPFEPPRQQVLVRCLAELPPELPAEVRRREARGAGQRRHVQRLAVAGVDQVLRAEQVAGGRLDRQHAPSIGQSDTCAIRK